MNVILFGAGRQALVDISTIEREGKHRIIGLVANNVPQGTRLAGGYKAIGGDDDIARLVDGAEAGLICVGDTWQRGRLADRIAEAAPDFPFISPVDPFTALAGDVQIGAGSRVTAGAVINPGTIIGEHCIINTRASVDHENVIGDFCSINPGATTGGRVHLGHFSVVGLGASVMQDTKIGEHVIIGAAALVRADIPDLSIAYGVPARVVRQREKGEPYL